MAHDNLGRLLLRKGDLAGAEAEYRKVVELDPKSDVGPRRDWPRPKRMSRCCRGWTTCSPAGPTPAAGRGPRLRRGSAVSPSAASYAAAARLFGRAFARRPQAGRRPAGRAPLRRRVLRRRWPGAAGGRRPGRLGRSGRPAREGPGLAPRRPRPGGQAGRPPTSRPTGRRRPRGCSTGWTIPTWPGCVPVLAGSTCRPTSGRPGTPLGRGPRNAQTRASKPVPPGRRSRNPGPGPPRACRGWRIGSGGVRQECLTYSGSDRPGRHARRSPAP